MANVTRYNAKDTSVIVDNVFITGLGENMITFSKDEAAAEMIIGAQGDVVKSEINNDLHTLTLAVQPTSPQLSFLISLKDRKDCFPVWVINKEMGITMGGSQGCILEFPEVSLSASAEDLEFSFAILDGSMKAD